MISQFKPNNYPQPRYEVVLDCSNEKILTDQSYKNSCDINMIMAQYEKTGLLPESATNALARYVDNTTAIPLEQAYELIQDATALFMELPASIRRQMNDNPQNLETFLADPDNFDQLIKHGLILPKAEAGSPSPAPQPAASATGGDPVKKTE